MTFKPKDKAELLVLLKKLIKERGNTGSFNDIDTSLITDMSGLFKGYPSFNGDISNWDVSNVTDMSHMFWGQLRLIKICQIGMFPMSQI